jgi:predicted methyltransferase
LILSYYQTRPLLEVRGKVGRNLEVSPDLGLSTVTVEVEVEGVLFPGDLVVAWEALEEISAHENNCYRVEAGEVTPIKTFSEHTNRPVSLYPTDGAPTLLISGLPMHRIKDTTPEQDTREKIKAIKPLTGVVLDTATGLGYTAIQAAMTANRVLTVEFDPAVLEIARQNPWSGALFENPRIEQRVGDIFDVIETLADSLFNRIIHDPPVMSLAGHLYSADFYRELHRVLRGGGRLFHYIGDPESKSGRSTTRGVIQRLERAGFRGVKRVPRAFGIVAQK